MNQPVRFDDICEVVKLSNALEVNAHFSVGWILLNVESNQYSEHGWSTSYVLGWKKANGEVKKPPERNFAEELGRDDVPFC